MKPITVTPTIDTSAYADGDQLGDLMTFQGPAATINKTMLLQAARIYDFDAQDVPIDLILFDTAPTPEADNAAFNLSEAELLTAIGKVSFSSYTDMGDDSVAFKDGLGIPIPPGTFYGLLVARGAGTYTDTDHLTVELDIIEYA